MNLLTSGEHGQISINGLDPSIAVKQHPNFIGLKFGTKSSQSLQQNHATEHESNLATEPHSCWIGPHTYYTSAKLVRGMMVNVLTFSQWLCSSQLKFQNWVVVLWYSCCYLNDITACACWITSFNLGQISLPRKDRGAHGAQHHRLRDSRPTHHQPECHTSSLLLPKSQFSKKTMLMVIDSIWSDCPPSKESYLASERLPCRIGSLEYILTWQNCPSDLMFRWIGLLIVH